MNRPDPAIDPTRCPLCGEPNRCAMTRESASGEACAPCWCTQVSFSDALLAQLPAAARGKACICRACAQMGSNPTPTTVN